MNIVRMSARAGWLISKPRARTEVVVVVQRGGGVRHVIQVALQEAGLQARLALGSRSCEAQSEACTWSAPVQHAARRLDAAQPRGVRTLFALGRRLLLLLQLLVAHRDDARLQVLQHSTGEGGRRAAMSARGLAWHSCSRRHRYAP